MGLMRIVFSKMYPDYPETAQYDNEGNYIEGGFGKGTTFIDYVNENWINKLPDLMTYQVGLEVLFERSQRQIIEGQNHKSGRILGCFLWGSHWFESSTSHILHLYF